MVASGEKADLRKRIRFMIYGRINEQTSLVHHPSERTCGVRPTREPKDTYLVFRTICHPISPPIKKSQTTYNFHEELVSAFTYARKYKDEWDKVGTSTHNM